MTEPAERTDEARDAVQDQENEEALDALGVLLVLCRRRALIAALTLVGFLAGCFVSIVLKSNYTAHATILPPQQQSSSAVFLNQLGSIGGLGGAASSLGLKTPADLYVGMLESRTIADALIGHFQLQHVYGQRTLQDVRAALRKHTTVDVGKDGIIEVSVTDHDARRASDLANGYIEQLDELNKSLAISEATQRRVFFESQLEGERKSLATAEENLRATQQRTGLIQLNGQSQLILQSITQLQADLASHQVQLQSMRSFATEQNPDLVRLKGEIKEMQGQLVGMEKAQERASRPGDTEVPSGSLPQDSLEYTRKLREVKYHESLLDLLSKQEEAARIDEAKSAPILQVIDHAIVSDKRSGPPRLLIILSFAFIGFALGSGMALTVHATTRLRRMPHQEAKMRELLSYVPRR